MNQSSVLGLIAFPLWVTLALWVSGCQTGGAKDADATAGAEGGSDPATTMADAEAAYEVRNESARVSAAAELDHAIALQQEGKYREAEQALVRTLELDPTNAEAQDRLREVRQTLGIDPAGDTGVFESLAGVERVKEQQVAIEIQARINRGHQAFDKADFETAEREFESALEIIRFQPYYHDHKGMRAEATEMLERSRMSRREAALDREEAIQAEAVRLRADEDRTRAERDEERIRTLFERGNAQFRKGNYSFASKIFEEVLRLDPTNATAARLRDTAREAHHSRQRDENLRMHIEEWRSTMEAHIAAETFQADVLVWPEEERWFETISRRVPRSGATGDEAMDPEDAAVWSRLRGTKVDVDFQEATLEEVRSFLQQVSGVNMILDPEVEADAGISLTLSDIELDQGLKIILELQGLAYRVENGVLIIATPEQTAGKQLLRMYDIRDLTGPLQDFPGPNIELNKDEEDEGFGISLGDEEPTGTISEDELQDLIQSNVFPESWDEEGANIEIRNRTLIVRNTLTVHREVEKLLGDLRQQGGILVTVESRFLTVEDNFLESVGVDWRGLGDAGLPTTHTPTGTTNANFNDLLVGVPNSPSPYQTIGADGTSGIYYDDGLDGDLRARVENLFDTVLGDSRVLTESGGLSLQYAILDDAELEFIVRAVRKDQRITMLTAPSVTAFNTQRAHVLVVNQIAYIKDYDVEVAQRAAIADPIIGTIQDGLVLDVRPIVSSDRRFITMELRPTIAELVRPIEVFETTLATGSVFSAATLVQIQIPELTLEKVRTTVTVPDGGTIMIGGLKTSRNLRRESSLPMLRRVPGGNLIFGKRGQFNNRESLVILIKAQITSLSESEPQERLNAY